MKSIAALFAAAITALAVLPFDASAQSRVITGPSFKPADIRAERFDAVFDHVVPVFPLYPLFRNQAEGARFDAVVCNQDAERRGVVRVTGTSTLGILNAGECTIFVNFENLDFSRLDGEYEWAARIYLRAHH